MVSRQNVMQVALSASLACKDSIAFKLCLLAAYLDKVDGLRVTFSLATMASTLAGLFGIVGVSSESEADEEEEEEDADDEAEEMALAASTISMAACVLGVATLTTFWCCLTVLSSSATLLFSVGIISLAADVITEHFNHSLN